jgi:DNA modification methylase
VKTSCPLNDLLKKDVPFEWRHEQEKAIYDLKDALINCPTIRPLDYTSSAPVILRVDTSWKAVGFWICQQDPKDKKKRYFTRFGSITLSDREARYSQPKCKLFGLFRVLEAAKYWLLGC